MKYIFAFFLLITSIYSVFAQETDELTIKGSTAFLKVSSGATVLVANSVTALNAKDNGTIVVESGGSMTADGTVNITTGSSIQVDGNLFVKGDWTNDATASTALAGASVGTVTFNGTGNQNIGGSVTTVFENFGIDNVAGVTLTANQTLSNELNFSNGIISTGANRLEMTGTLADHVSGSGPGRYVLGNLRRHVTTLVEYTLPMGTATNYEMARLFVNSQTGLSYVDVVFTESDQNPVSGSETIDGLTVDNFLNYGYWTLTPNGFTAVSYDFSGQSTGHTDLLPSEFNYGLLTDLAGGGIAWQDLGVHSNATQTYSASTVLAKRSQLTDFGSYIIGHTSTLTYTSPAESEELLITGATSIFKVSSGANVTLSNSLTALNTANSGTLSIEGGGSMTTEGGVNLASSGSVQIDGSLSLKGNWINNGTASTALPGAPYGTITFNGTSSQSIGGSVNTIFENLTINNSSGITLAQHESINAQLDFVAGIITTGANRLELINTSADYVSGGGTGRYVIGTIRRYVTPNVSYTLPIGTAAHYEMANLLVNSQTGLNYVDAVFTISDQNPVPGGLLVNGVTITDFLDYGYWTLTPNAGTTSVNYDFSGQSIGHTDLGADEFNYALISDLGSGWQSVGIHSIATQSYSAAAVVAKRGQLTSFGSYVIGRSNSVYYVTPVVTEEFLVTGATSILKVSSGAFLTVSNSITAFSTANGGTARIESGGVITAEGAVNLTSTGAIQVDGNLYVNGNWTNDGTASTSLAGGGVGTINFSGAANQNLGGSVMTVFENLTVNNPAGITLTSNQAVSETLTFTSGNISTGANRLELTNTSGDFFSGAGAGRSVVGIVRRYVVPGVEYTFPIGTTAQYEMARLFINASTGLTYVDATFTISNQNPAPGGLMVKGVTVNNFLDYGYWTLTPNGGVGAVSYDISAESVGHTDQGPDEFSYSLISDLGSGWQDLGVHSIATQSYSASAVLAKRGQLSAFGSYLIGHSIAPLYVTPAITEELRVSGATAVFKVSSGATVNLTNSLTSLNTSSSGTLYVESGATLTADGSVSLASASSIQVDGNLFVKGNWTNDATSSTGLAGATLGTITFNGAINQNIGGSLSTNFENFAVNNPAGITLTNNQTIGDALQFTSGIITTGVNRLELTNVAADFVSGSGPGNFVNGTLRRYVATNVEYALPIGSSTQYEMGKLFVNSQTGLTYIDATFTISNQNPVPGGLTVKGVAINTFLDYGYWTLTPNVVGPVSYDFSAQSIGHTDQGPDEFSYALISDLGGGWQDLGIHSIATQSYSASTVLAKRGQLNSFGNYVIGHSAASLYTTPTITEELNITGNSSFFKVSSGATVILTNSTTALNTSNSGVVAIESGGTLTAEGSVNLASSSSVQVDGNLFVKGNWSNGGTASTSLAGATVGTITFNGTANQNIGGATTTAFENFTIDNPAGVTLSNNESINNLLNFINGIITTGANRLELAGTAADYVSGSGTGKYVLGNLRRYVTPAIEYTLPIGTASNYEMGRLLVNSQTGLSYVDVIFTISDQNPVPGGLTVKGVAINDFLNYGYWTLTPNGGATANYDFSGQSTGHTDQGPDEFYYALLTDVGSGWQNLGIHSIATQTYSASTVLAKRSQLTGFGNYVIGHTLTSLYVTPTVTEELRIAGTTSIFKVSSGAAVNLTNSLTTLNTSTSGTLYVESGGTMTTDGAVLLASASSIQVDGNLFVKGNWTNDGTASTALAGATTGTITFNGTTNQSLGGSVNTIFENFTINNAAGLTLTGDETVSATLTLTNGIITTGAFTLSGTNSSAASLSAGSSSSFVFGNLQKSITTNTSTYTFAVGNSSLATGYHPVQFINNNLTGVSALSVSVAAISEIAPNNDATLNATKAVEDGILVTNILESAEWIIDPTGVPSGGSFGVNLFVTNVSGMSAADDNAFVVVKRPTGSATYDDWDTFFSSTTLPAFGSPGRLYNAGNGYAQKTGFTAFSRFAIGRLATALPIELLAFSAHYSEPEVVLKWTTATEINNDFFIVERSKDAVGWNFVNKVKGAGNSNQVLNYTSRDEKPLAGTSYYRLKQTDFDGRFTYSKVVMINLSDDQNELFDFSVYPNPSTGDNIILNVQYGIQDESDVAITISDLNGKFVYPKLVLQKTSEGFSTHVISLGGIAQGMYIMTGSSSKTTKTKKLIIE